MLLLLIGLIWISLRHFWASWFGIRITFRFLLLLIVTWWWHLEQLINTLSIIISQQTLIWIFATIATARVSAAAFRDHRWNIICWWALSIVNRSLNKSCYRLIEIYIVWKHLIWRQYSIYVPFLNALQTTIGTLTYTDNTF